MSDRAVSHSAKLERMHQIQLNGVSVPFKG